jgi:hypothetical protein
MELLTSSLVKNTNHWKKNLNYNIVDLATCKPCKMWLLDVKWSILAEYYNRIAKASMLYEFTDGPAIQPTENPPNSDGYGDDNGTVPESTVQVYWRPGPPIWLQFGSDRYPNPKWWSRPVANSTWECLRHVWESRQQRSERRPHDWECLQLVWERAESQWSSAGKTSCLGTWLVRLEMIATTYHSTIVKTHVFRLYSHRCIYVSIYLCIFIATRLHTINLDWLLAVLESNSRCAWEGRSSELRDTLRCRGWPSLDMHLEVVSEHLWRYTEC